MRKKIYRQLISLILCFSMLMPTLIMFAEEPTVTVESSDERYEIVDGSEIGESSGKKYFVKFVKTGETYKVVSVKPTRGSYTVIPGKTSFVNERVLVSPAREEDYTVTITKHRDERVKVVDSPATTKVVKTPYTYYVTTGYKKTFFGYQTVTKYKNVDVKTKIKDGYWTTKRVLVKKGYYKWVYDKKGDGIPRKQWVPAKYAKKTTYVKPVYKHKTKRVATTVEEKVYKNVPIKKAKTGYNKKTVKVPEKSHYVTRRVPYKKKVKRTRHISAVYKTVKKEIKGSNRYKVKVPAKWNIKSSSAVRVYTTYVWAPNGSKKSAYLKNNKTYLMNHQRVPNGYISYAGGIYYMKISDNVAQKSITFEPRVYETSHGKYYTSAQKRKAEQDDEKRKKESREYKDYENQIKTALTKKLRQIKAIVNSKSHLSGLLSKIKSRENYLEKRVSHPKVWTEKGERTSCIVLDGRAYNISTEKPLAIGYVYMIGDKACVVTANGPEYIDGFDQNTFERSKGQYKTIKETPKVDADIWDSTGNKVSGAFLQGGDYYVSDGNLVPLGYVIKVGSAYKFITSSGRQSINYFDPAYYHSSGGVWFNKYQVYLKELGYSVANKLDDSDAQRVFKSNFSVDDAVNQKIEEIKLLYESNLVNGIYNSKTEEIQIILKELKKEIIIDGLYGKKTKNVVKAYQVEKGFAVTEYCDKVTYDSLLNDFNESDGIPANVWDSKGNLVDRAFLKAGKYYIVADQLVPAGYVIQVGSSFMYTTSTGRRDISSFDSAYYDSTDGEWFNKYQVDLKNLGYPVRDKLTDSDAYRLFKSDFVVEDTVNKMIEEIELLYKNNLVNGNYNAKTEEIQKLLKVLKKDVNVDGLYSSQLKAIVRAYQRENGFTETEYCDQKTFDKLKEDSGNAVVIPEYAKKSIATLAKYYDDHKGDEELKAEISIEIKNKLIFLEQQVREYHKNEESSYNSLKKIYNDHNSLTLKIHFESVQNKIFNMISDKGRFYVRMPSGQYESQKYPVGNGIWVSRTDYLNWLKKASAESSKYYSKNKKFISGEILERKNELEALYESYLSCKQEYDKGNTEKKVKISGKYNLVKERLEICLNEMKLLLKTNKLPNLNKRFYEYFENGVDSFDYSILNDFNDQFEVELEYEADTFGSGFELGLTEDIVDIIDLFKFGEELAEEFKTYISTEDGRNQLEDLVISKVEETSKCYMENLVKGTLTIKLLLAWNKLTIKIWKGVIRGTYKSLIEKLEKPLGYQVGYVLGKLTFEAVSGLITGGCGVIMKAILKKILPLVKAGKNSIGYVFEVLEKVWESPKFKVVKDKLIEKTGATEIDMRLGQNLKEKVAKSQAIGEKVVDDHISLVNNIIEESVEGTSNLGKSFSSWDDMKKAYDGNITQFLADNKPKYSPNVEKWLGNGGQVNIKTVDGKQIWTYTSAAGEAVPYIDGFVKFPDEYLHPVLDRVNIGSFTGDRTKDMAKLKEVLKNDYGINEIPAGFVAHHDIENGIMQLVQEDIHKKFRHIGGHSLNQ